MKKVSGCGILSFDYWAQYFNVTSAEVGRRLLYTFQPVSNKFSKEIEGNPDLFGPFWLMTTLILVISITTNLAHWIEVGKVILIKIN